MKQVMRLALLVAAFAAGTANAALIATPSGPFDNLDDAFTAEIYSNDWSNAQGMAWLPDGRLIRTDTFGAHFIVLSATADTTFHGASTLHSATLQGVTGYAGGGFGVTPGNDGFLYGQSSSGLQKINPGTFTATTVAGTAAGTYGMETLSDGRIVYAANVTGQIRVYDPSTGSDVAIYNTGTLNKDIAVSPDGFIFVAAIGVGLAGTCRTDVITAAGVLIASSATSHCAAGLAFGQGQIYKSNTDGTLTRLAFSGAGYTGTITEELVGNWNVSTSTYTGSLAAFGPDGSLYLSGFGFDYPDDALGLAWTLVRVSPVPGGGGSNAVPEPGTLTLTVLALLGMGWMRRRNAVR